MDEPESSSFTCPICLGEKPAPAAASEEAEADPPSSPRAGRSFELTSCGHRFCAACLRAYVRSKLLDGEADVPCCHFRSSRRARRGEDAFEDDFRPCGAPILESDLRRLLHSDDALEEDDECRLLFGPADGGGRDYIGGERLWKKYQKLKFDERHGKGAVRRCPKCDEARLFDEESMGNYQRLFLTQRNAGPTSDERGGSSDGAVGRLERAFGAFRRRQRLHDRTSEVMSGTTNGEAPNDPVPDPSDAKIGSNDPGREAGGPLPEIETPPQTSIPDEEPPSKVSPSDEKPLPREGMASMTDEDPIQTHNEECGKNDSNSSDCDDRVGLCEQEPEKVPEPERVLGKVPEPEQGQEQEHGQSTDDASKGDSSTEQSRDQGQKAAKNDNSSCGPQDGEGSSASTDSKTDPAAEILPEQNESPSLIKSTTPIVTCQTCGTEFCYFHSNAHSGRSCIEYHKRVSELERTNLEYTSRVLRAKPCPNCGIAVSKEGGCNQIKCGGCGTHFCWLCGKVVDDGAFPEHFRWWNLRGCANMQLDENNEPMRCTIWGAKLLSVMQILVLGVPAVVLSIASMLLCPCFYWGCGTTNRERVINYISFWGSFLSSLLLFPFTCLGMVLLSALYCFLAGIALFFKVLTRRGRPMRNSENNVSREVGDTDAVVSADVTSNTDEGILREIESIFERAEEGLSLSVSH
ncbi:hypothetical protein ACHAWF_012658 [Thalassiosira exigua]